MKTIRTTRRAGLRTTGTVAEAQVDAWGAAQYEIALNLITDEGARSRFVLDTTAAIELGQALIAEAAVCARNSDAATEFDLRQLDATERRTFSVDDDMPF